MAERRYRQTRQLPGDGCPAGGSDGGRPADLPAGGLRFLRGGPEEDAAAQLHLKKTAGAG